MMLCGSRGEFFLSPCGLSGSQELHFMQVSPVSPWFAHFGYQHDGQEVMKAVTLATEDTAIVSPTGEVLVMEGLVSMTSQRHTRKSILNTRGFQLRILRHSHGLGVISEVMHPPEYLGFSLGM